MKSQKMKTYEVKRSVRGIDAYVDGEPLANVAYYSRSAFAIGYDGAGAGNLALSILVDYFGEKSNRKTLQKTKAWQYHQFFKFYNVVNASVDGFTVTSDEIGEWIETVDIVMPAVEREAERKERTRARHARESSAVAGAIVGTGREMIRKLKCVEEYYGDEVVERIRKGEGGRGELNRLYNRMRGDDRVGLYIKVPRDLRNAIRDEALERGVKMNELVVNTLTQIFGEANLGDKRAKGEE